MKTLIKIFRPCIVVMLMTWWYVVRPKTFGALVVIRHEDEILLVKTTYGYEYGLPGGGIKKGETPHEAAKREAFEEVGITLHDLVPLPSFVTREEYKTDTIYSFYAHVTSKMIILDKIEIDSAEWHPLTKLPTTSATTEKILKLYKSNIIEG